MFQIKSKIFAASVLGVSILLVTSLVSFTIYLVTKSNAAYDGTSVGYIFGGSYDESYKMSQQLLKDKVVQQALVVPTFLHNQKESPSKIISVLTTSHLLLVQTSAELIPRVKDAVMKASKNSDSEKVWTAVFSATAEATPFLSFVLPTAPQSQVATKDLSTTNSFRLPPVNADRQNGNIFRKLAAITIRSLTPGELASWPRMDTMITDIANQYDTFAWNGTSGRPFLIKVVGTRKAGYIWTLGPRTSPSLQLEYFDKNEDGSVLDDALLYIKGICTTNPMDDQYIELNYADPAGSGPPMPKLINFMVVGLTHLVQL